MGNSLLSSHCDVLRKNKIKLRQITFVSSTKVALKESLPLSIGGVWVHMATISLKSKPDSGLSAAASSGLDPRQSGSERGAEVGENREREGGGRRSGRRPKTHHCAPIRAAEGRTGSVAASLVSSATCWLAHQQSANKKMTRKAPLKK